MKKSIVKYVIYVILNKKLNRELTQALIGICFRFSFIIFTIVYVFLCFHVLIFIGFIYAIQFLKILMYYSMNLTVRADLQASGLLFSS